MTGVEFSSKQKWRLPPRVRMERTQVPPHFHFLIETGGPGGTDEALIILNKGELLRQTLWP